MESRVPPQSTLADLTVDKSVHWTPSRHCEDRAQ